MPRIQVAAQGVPDHDPRTDHLRPVMEHLLAQGNRPAHWWHADGWRSDSGGELQYAFIALFDAAELRERFSFPLWIQVQEDGSIIQTVVALHQGTITCVSEEKPRHHFYD